MQSQKPEHRSGLGLGLACISADFLAQSNRHLLKRENNYDDRCGIAQARSAELQTDDLENRDQ